MIFNDAPSSIKRLNDLQQEFGAFRYTVQTGNHHGITNPDIRYQVVQLCSVAFRTGRLFLDDVASTGGFEKIELHLNVLSVNC